MKKAYMMMVLVFFLSLTQCVNAAKQTHEKLAEELLNLLQFEKMIMQTFEQIKRIQLVQMEDMIKQNEKNDMVYVEEQLTEIMSKELNWEKIKGDYITLCSEAFTNEELRGLIEFHKSPLGQKYLNSMPRLVSESLQISQKHINNIALQIQGIIAASTKNSEKNQQIK